ncbi:class II aldolase/adducin family protein [Methylococcus sp. EFPC2]|uniref:class II aldolase/adducin family protein n=1 Tax=Methylococcus sp. EFPC2 TaxID=2812648 RepID=UPI001F07FBFD|nr:class II aldolase/adducin family protein [Methylococcus sp. EFPC2]
MTEREGIIKYRLDYTAATLERPEDFAELNAWRGVLWRLGLIGQDDARYGGLGFGNVSLRLDEGGFLVTGTQTGHIPHLSFGHYVRVVEARPADNYLRALGPLPPSSEALTHAAVYGVSPRVRCVAHGHSPEIWRQATKLGLPTVGADIAYGTPAMAAAVSERVRLSPDGGIVAMLGHEDGLLAWGATPERTCWVLAGYLAKTWQAME